MEKLSTTTLYPIDDGVPVSKIFDHLIKIWDKKRGDRPAPTKDEFSFKDLIGWHSSFVLCEYIDNGDDSVIRIMGENALKMFEGISWKGMRFTELSHPNIPKLLKYHKDIKEIPAIGIFKGYLPNRSRDHLEVEMIDFPIAGKSGEIEYRYTFTHHKKKSELAQIATI